jgi:hypothetical protein
MPTTSSSTAPAPSTELQAAEAGRQALTNQLYQEVVKVERAPLHELTDILAASLKRVLELAAADNSILHEGNLVSRLTFATDAAEKLQLLKKFTGSVSTWHFLHNDGDHRVFKNGDRSKFCRTVCTVDTALAFLRAADINELRQTGNFVIKNPDTVAEFTAGAGMWQLQCNWEQRPHNKKWVKVKEDSELRWNPATYQRGTHMLSINGFELSETWTCCVDECQLQQIKSKTISDDVLNAYVNLWLELIVEEKTRQRVCKPENYSFRDDGLNMPWQFATELGYKTLPIVVWMKKHAAETEQPSRPTGGWGGQAWSDPPWQRHGGKGASSSSWGWQERDVHRR